MPVSELSEVSAIFKSTKSLVSSCNMVISSLSESELYNQTIISSGFQVGVDNWEFVNWGSYIAPGGHCAGQNMAAMWYYYEKKLNGEAPLYNRFSTINDIWEDNSIGYRFCSVLQNDLATSGLVIDYFSKYIDMDQKLDAVKFLTLAGAMLVTGEPQGVGIYKEEKQKNNSIIYSGHDLICYKVSMSENKLYICDPNYPNDERSIILKNGKFEPISIALNGSEPSSMFPYITWYAKTAWIEWNLVGKRYAELLDGTIGNIAPNIFPEYSIKVKGDLQQNGSDGYTSSEDSLVFYVECPKAIPWVVKDDVVRIGITLLDEKGSVIHQKLNDSFYLKTTQIPAIISIVIKDFISIIAVVVT